MVVAIVNKFAGTCATCNTRVAKGEGITKRVNNKWAVYCTKDAGETHGATNPWRDAHRTAEMDYTGGEYTRSKARQMVDNEYHNTDQLAEPCECGGTCHWKATVGARICPSCGRMVVYRIDQTTHKVTRSVVR